MAEKHRWKNESITKMSYLRKYRKNFSENLKEDKLNTNTRL